MIKNEGSELFSFSTVKLEFCKHKEHDAVRNEEFV